MGEQTDHPQPPQPPPSTPYQLMFMFIFIFDINKVNTNTTSPKGYNREIHKPTKGTGEASLKMEGEKQLFRSWIEGNRENQ